jgi:hypothetical protein
LDEEKSKNTGLSQENGFLAQHNCVASKKAPQGCATAEKSVINMT